MRRFIDVQCGDCGVVQKDRYIEIETERCACGGMLKRIRLSPPAVIGDDIPGGVDIRHGICHPDGTPRRFYSRTDIRKAAKAAGLEWGHDTNRHVPNPKRGTDKHFETRRW